MDFDWVPGGREPAEWAMTCSSAICGLVDRLMCENVPELAGDSPIRGGIGTLFFFADDWVAIRMSSDGRNTIQTVGPMRPPMVGEAEALFREGGVAEAFHTTASTWNDGKTFTYIGPRRGRALSWPDVADAVVTWMNATVLPSIFELNRRRVLHAIPAAPLYRLDDLFQALWVLECEKDMQQGTAFALAGRGLVTCQHCFGAATKAFQWSAIDRKYPVTVARSHERLDLAILDGVPVGDALRAGSPSGLKQMDHILVLGHPNHRIGDTPVCSPGLVVGFRPFSGVRRILTNAAIVAGASGGPVVDSSGDVVGVAVCGARTFGTAAETEDHAIIPIDALDLL